MTDQDLEKYQSIHAGSYGFFGQKRGLFAVWGVEAVRFLNGLMTNDIAILEDDAQILAAFPNAQGRLLSLVRVLRKGDRFLLETEEQTREKLFNNLFRFTFAGDFFVEDLSDKYSYFSVFNFPDEIRHKCAIRIGDGIFFDNEDDFKLAVGFELSGELYELLRLEKGIPLFGIDVDESTIIPEIGLDGLISYNKGCYIGQEIIARIHFRGHIAKQLKGLILEENIAKVGDELMSVEGKNAGRITSVCFSPKLDENIALAFVRYDYLADGTILKFGETDAEVKDLPFFE